ncbi:MAG TPA: hypothetical protein PLL20_01480 [Phycisphaerae bacterium]|nr:hypothetical protein [Phycisphaerae bacterium]
MVLGLLRIAPRKVEDTVAHQTFLPTRPIGTRFGRWIGAALLLHFAYVVGLINLVRQSPGEVLWLCHISLLLAGLGLVTQSVRLVAIACTAVALPHTFWLIDSLSGLLLGWFPLGATAYILTTDTWTRIATAHHFYLAPLLLVIVWRHGSFSRLALPAASLLFLLLSVTCRVAVSPALNVNYAFFAVPAADHPFVTWVNSLDAIPYLLLINAIVTGVMFAPVALLMTCHAQKTTHAQNNRSVALPALQAPQ